MHHPSIKSNGETRGDHPLGGTNSERKTEQGREPPLSDEEVENIVEFILCVREILENLQARGYNIQTGELVRPGHDDEPRS